MRRRSVLRATIAVAGLAAPGPALAEDCPSLDQIVTATLASETRARSDVTDAFACRFPEGLPFNDAAKLLDAAKFDLLNPTERMFHRWKLPGEEYVSRRRFSGFWSNAEIRVTIHVADRKIVRFSAQYFSGR